MFNFKFFKFKKSAKSAEKEPLKEKGGDIGLADEKPIKIDINSFIANATDVLIKNNEIESELYVENDVKRGLRNSNGTGVVVGLTRIGTVDGYEVNDKGEKVAVEGKLLYRGYDVEDIVNNCLAEERPGFEETTYLLLFGELPDKKQLAEFT